MNRPIYLDYQATTPTDPGVLRAMLPYFNEEFGNPHSTSHAFGFRADEAVTLGRRQIAELIAAESREIVLTSGATEANNLALKGAVAFHTAKTGRNHVVVAETEHKSVLETCRSLTAKGVSVTYLPVGNDGLVDPEALRRALSARTLLVSIMAVNNEIGVVQPLAAIGKLCRENGVFFHTDAAQATGKIALDVEAMKIDLLSLSGHKMYGPKGIGALYVRRRPRVRLTAQIDGGGQERGLRSGTLATPLVVGFGEACAIADREMAREDERIRQLRDRLYNGVAVALSGVTWNGHRERRIPGNLNLSFEGIDGETLIRSLPDLALSPGSACTSSVAGASHVLHALGVGRETAVSAVRFGIGRYTSEADIDHAVTSVVRCVKTLRARHRSPAVRESVAADGAAGD